jgi:hypothetical protein
MSSAADDEKKPSMDVIAAAAIVLLKKLVENTDEIEAMLRDIRDQGDETNALLKEILDSMNPPPEKVLTSIKVIFKGVKPMPPLTPPIVLTQEGQQVVAEVVGYDQFGQQWTDPFDFTLSNDDEDVATLDPSTGMVTAVANGVANITGTALDADGNELTDTEPVTVNIAQEAPVLTTIKVQFSSPTAASKHQQQKKPGKR